MDLPKEVKQFVDNLVPTDVGKDTVGDYIIHYEGFTDECNDGHDDVSIDSEYAEVYQDFDDRQGKEALIRGDLNDLIKSINLSWENKKKSSTKISNSRIDLIYKSAMEEGALAGKVSGAGGGGFIIIFGEERHIKTMMKKHKQLIYLKFNLSTEGSNAISIV